MKHIMKHLEICTVVRSHNVHLRVIISLRRKFAIFSDTRSPFTCFAINSNYACMSVLVNGSRTDGTGKSIIVLCLCVCACVLCLLLTPQIQHLRASIY